jgi:hypothetical protein
MNGERFERAPAARPPLFWENGACYANGAFDQPLHMLSWTKIKSAFRFVPPGPSRHPNAPTPRAPKHLRTVVLCLMQPPSICRAPAAPCCARPAALRAAAPLRRAPRTSAQTSDGRMAGSGASAAATTSVPLTAAAAAAKYGWDLPVQPASAAPSAPQPAHPQQVQGQQPQQQGQQQQQQQDAGPGEGTGGRRVQDIPVALIRRPLGRTRANGAGAGRSGGRACGARPAPAAARAAARKGTGASAPGAAARARPAEADAHDPQAAATNRGSLSLCAPLTPSSRSGEGRGPDGLHFGDRPAGAGARNRGAAQVKRGGIATGAGGRGLAGEPAGGGGIPGDTLPKPNDHNPTAASLGFRTAPRPGPPSQPALTPTGIGTPTQPRRARFHPPSPPPLNRLMCCWWMGRTMGFRAATASRRTSGWASQPSAAA